MKADKEDQIKEYLESHGSITNKQARELLGLADSTVKRLLGEMVKKGTLRSRGEKRYRTYELSD